MNIIKKRAQHRKAGIKYFYPHFTDEDIKEFSPEHFKDLDAALKNAERLIISTAHASGFYKRDIWQSGIESVKGRITDYYIKEMAKNEDH